MPDVKSKLVFNQAVKQSGIEFIPNKVVYGFEDPDAGPYFIAAGWAEASNDEPDLVIGINRLDIDPDAVWATGPNRGQKVLGGKAGDGTVKPAKGTLK